MTNLIFQRPVKRTYLENFPYLGNTSFPLFKTALFSGEMSDVINRVSPAANILEDDQKFIIELAVPSFSKENISIEKHENVLVVNGNKSETDENENVRFHLRQFNNKSFSRTFRMPASADMESVEAAMKDGILTLSISKKQRPAPKTIEIQ